MRHARSAAFAVVLAVVAGVIAVPGGYRGQVLPAMSGEEVVALEPTPSAAGTPVPSPTPAPSRAPDPGPDDVRLVAAAPTPMPVSQLTGYVWPLPRGRLTQAYGFSRWGGWRLDGKPFHDGIDLATFCGDRILAAHDGVVLTAGRRYDEWLGWRGDLGPYHTWLDRKKLWSSLPIVVVIDDGNTYRSVYAHLRRAVVKPGQRVRAGQLIGYEGATGNASGCHLHYGLFSPYERASLQSRPEAMKKMSVPAEEVMRIDPLLVLPPRPSPKPKPSPAPTPAPSTAGGG